MRRAPSRASSSRLGPTTAAAVVASVLLSGILCMGSVSFLAPRGRSRSLQPEGYAAFFMLPVHNLRVYLKVETWKYRTLRFEWDQTRLDWVQKLMDGSTIVGL